MRNRIIIVFVALSVASSFFSTIALNASLPSFQQRTRKKQSRRPNSSSQTNNRKGAARDFSKFLHGSNKHESLSCDACHKAPTVNWPTASGFPDVADYPGHDACTRCHRNEFFKGARPIICSVCHTTVSPRGKTRFEFKRPNQSTQFRTIFPHNKHQDVIATTLFNNRPQAAHAFGRRNASIGQDKTDQKYNNCTICHETNAKTLSPPGGFPDDFHPPAGTFKTAPVGHALCFNCHWKNEEPTRNQCKGCHEFSREGVPIIFAPSRKSLKFTHTREQHTAECTYCHINITRVSSLRELRPDVPITSCSESSCHGARPDKLAITIETEYERRNGEATFVCSKCHTSDFGKLATPASHRALFIE